MNRSIIETVLSYKDVYHLKGVSGKTIKLYEKKLLVSFSNDYCDYLKAFGVASVNSHDLTGICKSKRLNVVDVTKEERERMPEVPQNWYVIEQAHIDGIVIWQDGDGKVYQTAPGTEPLKIADSLVDYIKL